MTQFANLYYVKLLIFRKKIVSLYVVNGVFNTPV